MIGTEQYAVLLRPLHVSRVAKRKQAGKELSYVEAWDIKAHLTRIFGFGGWSADVTESVLEYASEVPAKNGGTQWDVGYRVTLRLTIHGIAPGGGDVTYTESAVGNNQGPQRGEVSDNAIKSGASDALKRCAINLGTQFGLSLYDNGSRNDVVGFTLRPPEGYVAPERTEAPAAAATAPAVPVPDGVLGAVQGASTEAALKALWDEALDAGYIDSTLDDAGTTLRLVIGESVTALRERGAGA
jgi:hypothetical protein